MQIEKISQAKKNVRAPKLIVSILLWLFNCISGVPADKHKYVLTHVHNEWYVSALREDHEAVQEAGFTPNCSGAVMHTRPWSKQG